MDKNKLVAELMEKLFEAEKRRLANVITELNRSNKLAKSLQMDGFLFGGQLYMPTGVSTTVAGPGQAKATLHFGLNDQMETWLRDQKVIRDDQDLIRQMLFRLLKSCNSEREIRSALPECLISLVQGLGKEPRADREGYTLDGDERATRQFLKLLPKMEFYSVTRLLY